MRNIKLMADYECFALWDEDAVDNLNPDDLLISDHLKLRIHRWENMFDATLDRSNPANSGFSTTNELQRFDEEGIDLWVCIRRELGEDYVVRYFSPLSRTVIEP
jgi:hypothetical protein